ncbi:MAG TPA: hypothetical protein VH601_13270 [Bryobacteraceae bacterium]
MIEWEPAFQRPPPQSARSNSGPLFGDTMSLYGGVMQPKIRVYLMTLLSVVLPCLVFAKSDTIRIVIRGAALSKPIEISDPALIHRFNVWSGPMTSSNDSEGLNVDWSRGIAHPPSGLEKYIVSFITTRPIRNAYVVHYEADPSTKEGYVYIPGKNDAGYRDNVSLIYHGIEGNWFYASKAWQALADPLILKTLRTASK